MEMEKRLWRSTITGLLLKMIARSFFDALLNPPAPNDKLKAAMKKHAEFKVKKYNASDRSVRPSHKRSLSTWRRTGINRLLNKAGWPDIKRKMALCFV